MAGLRGLGLGSVAASVAVIVVARRVEIVPNIRPIAQSRTNYCTQRLKSKKGWRCGSWARPNIKNDDHINFA
eukprot:1004762-Amphidinium_carterae.2